MKRFTAIAFILMWSMSSYAQVVYDYDWKVEREKTRREKARRKAQNEKEKKEQEKEEQEKKEREFERKFGAEIKRKEEESRKRQLDRIVWETRQYNNKRDITVTKTTDFDSDFQYLMRVKPQNVYGEFHKQHKSHYRHMWYILEIEQRISKTEAIFYVKTRQQIIPRSERAKYSDGFINYSIICIEGFNNTFLNKNEYLVTSNHNPLTKVDDKTLSSGVVIPSYTFKDPEAVEKWNISEIKPKPENKEKTVTPSLSPWQ